MLAIISTDSSFIMNGLSKSSSQEGCEPIRHQPPPLPFWYSMFPSWIDMINTLCLVPAHVQQQREYKYWSYTKVGPFWTWICVWSIFLKTNLEHCRWMPARGSVRSTRFVGVALWRVSWVWVYVPTTRMHRTWKLVVYSVRRTENVHFFMSKLRREWRWNNMFNRIF